MEKISIVVPFYNEEPMAEHFFEVLYKTVDVIKEKYEVEIIAVNDGSKDKTLDILKDIQKNHDEIKIVNLTRNFGHESAVLAGLTTSTGDAVIPLDADLQDPPELMLEMIKKYEEGYDVVNAKRASRKEDSYLKRTTAKLFYKIIDKLSEKVRIPQNVGHYRLISRRALDEVLSLGEVNRVFRVEVPFVGYKTCEVSFVRQSREFGKTHYNYASMINLASDSITSTTIKPLRLILKSTIVLMVLFCLSFITMFVFDICYWVNEGPIDKISLLVWLIINISLFLTILIFMALSIMAEYLGKTFKESQHRPFFLIDEIIENKK